MLLLVKPLLITIMFVAPIIPRLGCLQLGLLLVAAVFHVVIALLVFVGPLNQPSLKQSITVTVLDSLLSLVHRDQRTIMNPHWLLNQETFISIHPLFNFTLYY